MASSQVHFRSISLPSRLHPSGFEAELTRLKSSCISKEVPVTSLAILSALVELNELYNYIEKVGKSPFFEQSLLLDHQGKGKSVEDSLDLSVELLDSCSSIKELAQMIRENVQALQSAIRRKGMDIHNDIVSYLCFRKKMNKGKAKRLVKLKNLENRSGQLGEACGLNIAIFRWSLLLFSPPASAGSGGWNLVSRLMSSKSAAGDKDLGVAGEVGCVDFALNRLQARARSSISTVSDVQMVQKSLQNLDACVEGIEKGLDRLFRQLIRSRVALLNVLADHRKMQSYG